jgi:transcriptional regulator with XRE-family HTH domain
MENVELSKLAENIRSSRRRLSITQESLAERCGLHRTYICDAERGVRNVSFQTLVKLARGLKTTVSKLTENVCPDNDPQVQISVESSPRGRTHQLQ